MQDTSISVGWTTTETRAEALRLGRGLVEARLAACVQVSGPIASVYRWQDAVESAEEFRLTIKFSTNAASAVAKWLKDNHTYDTPQWVCWRLDGGAEKYLKWVTENSSNPPLTQPE